MSGPPDRGWATPPATPRSLRLSPAAITVIITGVLGFFCSLNYTQESNLGGEYSCNGFDAAALVLGVVVGIAGVVTLVGSRRRFRRRPLEIPVGLVGIALGAVHVLRGLFDVFGELC